MARKDASTRPAPCDGNRSARNSTLLVACLVLAGCTTGSRSTLDTFRLVTHKPARATLEGVAANRFPQAQIAAPDIEALAVLGYIDGGRQQWYAGTHAVFELDGHGQLLGTSGLGRQFQARIVGDSPFARLLSVDGPVTVERRYDWVPAYQLDAPVTGTLARRGTQTLDVLGTKRDVIRFEEQLRGSGMRATNLYWADARTGFIWKSRQYLAPGYAVEIVQLKPYSPAKD